MCGFVAAAIIWTESKTLLATATALCTTLVCEVSYVRVLFMSIKAAMLKLH